MPDKRTETERAAERWRWKVYHQTESDPLDEDTFDGTAAEMRARIWQLAEDWQTITVPAWCSKTQRNDDWETLEIRWPLRFRDGSPEIEAAWDAHRSDLGPMPVEVEAGLWEGRPTLEASSSRVGDDSCRYAAIIANAEWALDG